jgi:hypothetical protein
MIDMSKKYRTRDGRDVRIYAADAGGAHPVHGAVLRTGPDVRWLSETWDDHGHIVEGRTNARPNDLVEVKAEVWIWRHRDNGRNFTAHDTKEDCENWSGARSMTEGQAVRFVQEDEA